jgi:hypothetical protein
VIGAHSKVGRIVCRALEAATKRQVGFGIAGGQRIYFRLPGGSSTRGSASTDQSSSQRLNMIEGRVGALVPLLLFWPDRPGEKDRWLRQLHSPPEPVMRIEDRWR